MQQLQVSEATSSLRRIPFRMVDLTDGKTAETGLSFSAGDLKLSKNGGSTANHAGSITEIGNGVYYYEATQAELDTIGFLTIWITNAAAVEVVAAVQIVSFDPYDSVRAGLTGIPALALPSSTVAADGGNTAETFKTNLTQTADDYWRGTILRWTGGALQDQVGRVIAYDGTTKFITVVSPGFTAAPATSAPFELLTK